MKIIEIPIYRVTFDKWDIEENKEKQKLFEYFTRRPENRSYRTKEKVDNDYDQRYGKSWKYNDIVGYIMIESSGGGKIYGDYFFSDAKHLVRNGKKTFKYQGKLFEIWIGKGETNDQIVRNIIDTLGYYQKKYFKKRYFYLEYLESIGKYIEWNKLLFNT